MSSSLEKLLEDIKPTIHEIVKESGTLLPDFMERRVAEKYVRSTVIVLIAKYGPQISEGIAAILPLAEKLFKQEYYQDMLLLKDIADTPLNDFGSYAAVNARQDSKQHFNTILK